MMARAAKSYNGNQPKQERLAAADRGYDREWYEVAKRFKQANPLCVDCLQQGRTRPAQEIHHVKKVVTHPELRLDWSNLMALCKVCHAIRTRRGE